MFDHILPNSAIAKVTIEFSVVDLNGVDFGMLYACDNCVVDKKQILHVNIQ